MNKVYIVIVPIIVVIRYHAEVALEGNACFAFKTAREIEVFKRSKTVRETMVFDWVKNHTKTDFEDVILGVPEYYDPEIK